MSDKEKDIWDKVDIIVRTTVLGIIPIVITFGANNIANSLKTGELVQSLISDLAQPDTKRDVALIALDAAIQKTEKCTTLWFWGCQEDLEQDQVLKIAIVLVSNSIDNASKKGQSLDELKVAQQIITKRASQKFYDDNFGKRYQKFANNAQRQVISNVQVTELSPTEIASKADTAQTLAAIQPSIRKPTVRSLAGVRLIYIQYQSNKGQAEKLQRDLQSKGILAPGIEQVEGIKQNDIRYANATDKQIAEGIQAYLEKEQRIQFEELIDLSKENYRVPSGQFEIWLK